MQNLKVNSFTRDTLYKENSLNVLIFVRGRQGPSKGPFWAKTGPFGALGVPQRSIKGPKHLIWMRPTQAQCVEVFWTPVGPSRPTPGLRGGPKGAPKIFTFWPFQPSKRPRGQSSRHQNIKLPRWPLEVQPGLHFYSFGLQTTSDVG